jgi:hypothetical protein
MALLRLVFPFCIHFSFCYRVSKLFKQNDDTWWDSFSKDAKVAEDQAASIKQVRHDHFLEYVLLFNYPYYAHHSLQVPEIAHK